jgi:hypothetical protein
MSSPSTSLLQGIVIEMGMISLALSLSNSLAMSTICFNFFFEFGLSSLWLFVLTFIKLGLLGPMAFYSIYRYKRLLPTWQGPALAFLASLVYTVSTCAGIVLGDWMDSHTLGFSLPNYAPSAIFMAWFAIFQLFLIFDAVTPCMDACLKANLGSTAFGMFWTATIFFRSATEANQTLSMEIIVQCLHFLFTCSNM